MLQNIPKNNLYTLFPIPCKSIETRGFANGVILKFKTFYLKIYDGSKYDTYDISGYRYFEQIPVFNKIIPTNNFMEFASKFIKEDYLCEYVNK